MTWGMWTIAYVSPWPLTLSASCTVIVNLSYNFWKSCLHYIITHTNKTRGFLIILVSKRLSFWKNLSLKIFCQTAVGPTYKLMLRLYMLISQFKLFGRDSEISIFLIPNLYMLISPLMPEILFAFFICIAKIHCMTMTSGAELLIELWGHGPLQIFLNLVKI